MARVIAFVLIAITLIGGLLAAGEAQAASSCYQCSCSSETEIVYYKLGTSTVDSSYKVTRLDASNVNTNCASMNTNSSANMYNSDDKVIGYTSVKISCDPVGSKLPRTDCDGASGWSEYRTCSCIHDYQHGLTCPVYQPPYEHSQDTTEFSYGAWGSKTAKCSSLNTWTNDEYVFHVPTPRSPTATPNSTPAPTRCNSNTVIRVACVEEGQVPRL